MVSNSDLALYQESEFLRECAVAEKNFELVRNECAYLESMMTNKLKLNLQQAELKVITESGSMDDMVLLANAAITEAEEAKPSIFAKFWTGFTTFLTNTWNAIQKVFTGKNTEAYNKLNSPNIKVRFNYDVKAITAAADQAVGEMKKGVGIKGAIAAAATAVVGGLSIGAIIKKHKEAPKAVELTGTEAVEVADKAKGIFSTITDFMKKIKPEEAAKEAEADTTTQSKVSIWQTVASFIRTHILDVVSNKIKELGGGKAKANAEAAPAADPNAAAPATPAQPVQPAQPAVPAAPATPAQPAQ